MTEHPPPAPEGTRFEEQPMSLLYAPEVRPEPIFRCLFCERYYHASLLVKDSRGSVLGCMACVSEAARERVHASWAALHERRSRELTECDSCGRPTPLGELVVYQGELVCPACRELS